MNNPTPARKGFDLTMTTAALSDFIVGMIGREAFIGLTRIFTGPPGVARQEDFTAIAATGGSVAKVYIDDNKLADGPQFAGMLMSILAPADVVERAENYVSTTQHLRQQIVCKCFGSADASEQHMLLLAMTVPVGSDDQIDMQQAPLELLAGVQKVINNGVSLVGLAKDAIAIFNNRGTDEVPPGTWHATGHRPVAHQAAGRIPAVTAT